MQMFLTAVESIGMNPSDLLICIIFEATFRGGFTIDDIYWYLSDVAGKHTFVALPTYCPCLC